MVVSFEMSVLFGQVQILDGVALVVVRSDGRIGSFGWLMSYKNFGTMGTKTKNKRVNATADKHIEI